MSNSLKLLEITDKNKWNDFVGAQAHAEFLQSWEWGEFQEKVEGKVTRFIVEDKDVIFAAATLIKKSLPLGMNYFYCPRGIIINGELKVNQEVLYNFFFEEIKKIAKNENVIFLRFEPREKFQISPRPELGTKANFKFQISKSIDIQPSKTIMLDLSKSEEVLLATMHQKTRYNIRLAEKKGVKIIESGQGGFEDFWRLMEKTSGRDGFTSHQKDYYEKLLQTAPDKFKLFTAVYQDKVIAAGIFSLRK